MVDLDKMGEPFAEEFKVLECECDFRGELMMGGLLRLVQQVGTDQCYALGMDDDFYKEQKAVFLLGVVAHFSKKSLVDRGFLYFA